MKQCGLLVLTSHKLVNIDLRTNPFQEKGNDVIQGLLTRNNEEIDREGFDNNYILWYFGDKLSYQTWIEIILNNFLTKWMLYNVYEDIKVYFLRLHSQKSRILKHVIASMLF